MENGTYIVSVKIPKNNNDESFAFEQINAAAYLNDCIGVEEDEKNDSFLVKLSFLTAEKAENASYAIQCNLPSVEIDDVKFLVSQDWNEKWRSLIQPVRVAKKIWVAPIWRKPVLLEDEQWIKIEPKMAFGSGHHETTRLAACAITSLCSEDRNRYRLLDIGAGSGILCFVGKLLGYKLCVGAEVDIVCLSNISENRSLNSGEGKTEFFIGSIDCISKSHFFSVIVMNMIRTESEPLLACCENLLEQDGHLIWSGILLSERVEVFSKAATLGFLLHKEFTEGEWWCGVFKRSVNCTGVN